MAAAAPSKGLVALFKRGWNEIPEVIGSGALALFGAGLMVYACQREKANDYYRPYKLTYTVVRHDDPIVDFIKKHEKPEK